jgi:hypothetical protein
MTDGSKLSVILPRGFHPFPSRTRKLSPAGPMVLHAKVCGRVGSCRHKSRPRSEMSVAFSCPRVCYRSISCTRTTVRTDFSRPGGSVRSDDHVMCPARKFHRRSCLQVSAKSFSSGHDSHALQQFSWFKSVLGPGRLSDPPIGIFSLRYQPRGTAPCDRRL